MFYIVAGIVVCTGLWLLGMGIDWLGAIVDGETAVEEMEADEG